MTFLADCVNVLVLLFLGIIYIGLDRSTYVHARLPSVLYTPNETIYARPGQKVIAVGYAITYSPISRAEWSLDTDQGIRHELGKVICGKKVIAGGLFQSHIQFDGAEGCLGGRCYIQLQVTDKLSGIFILSIFEGLNRWQITMNLIVSNNPFPKTTTPSFTFITRSRGNNFPITGNGGFTITPPLVTPKNKSKASSLDFNLMTMLTYLILGSATLV